MKTRGFTLVEMVLVLVMMAVVLGLSFPPLMSAYRGANLRSARVALGTMVAKARAAAVERGCRSAIHFTSGSSGTVWVTVCKLNGAASDTLGGVEPLASRFGVTLTAARDSITYAPNGLSFDGTATVLRLTSDAGQDSLTVNALGRVAR